MELKVFRDVLPAAGADCTAKAELPLETELLISDYLPPVQRIVKCFAKPVVLQKQLAPGRLTLEGYLRCTVYYQGEEGAGLCQTEQKLPFTKALELPSFAATAWTACVEGQTEYLNCRAVNPRRIEVRGAYGLVVSVHAQLSTEVITALSEGGIEQKPVTLAGVRRAATLEKLVTIEGALTFPKPPAAILDITGTAEVRELKRMQGKAVAKGVLHVLCGWRAEGDAALRSQTADLPFNQILDADGLSEDCRCLCVLEPVGFAAAEGETTEDGAASTTLTATAMLRLSGWRPYQLQCVADAFSTRFETTLTPQTLATESLLCALDETTVLRGSGPLPDAGAHILACFASFGPVSLTRQEGRAVLTARAVVSAFAENTLGEMECYEKALDYALPLPADLPPDTDAYPECWLSVQDLQCASAGGALEVSLTVRAEGAVLARQTASLADEVELLVNGKSQGIKRKGENEYHLSWRVKYEPGTVKAISRKNGQMVLEQEIRTAGEPAQIRLTADRRTIKADGKDLSFVTVEILDKNGTLCPNADNLVRFEVSGNTFIAGVDNGSPYSMERFKDNKRKAFYGKCLVVLQNDGTKGKSTLKAISEGLEAAEITLSGK